MRLGGCTVYTAIYVCAYDGKFCEYGVDLCQRSYVNGHMHISTVRGMLICMLGASKCFRKIRLMNTQRFMEEG